MANLNSLNIQLTNVEYKLTMRLLQKKLFQN